MPGSVRTAWRLAACVVSAAAAVACAAVPPPSPKLMARCTQLYALWARYEQHTTFHHTGQRARAELAAYDCEKGEYAPGIAELERLLRRGRFPIPPQ